MKAETDKSKMTIQTAPLVIAVRASISGMVSFVLTIIRVFCRVSIETSASIKLIVRSSRIRPLPDLRRLFRWTEAIVTLYVVYAAMVIAGINVIWTGFC